MNKLYTTQLQAGLGQIDETLMLLDLWEEGYNANKLFEVALSSGIFPQVTARRLRNMVVECFAPRYLVGEPTPASILKKMKPLLTNKDLIQLLFIYTCRANVILADFVTNVYWMHYTSGYNELNNENAKQFVTLANNEGKTKKHWSESTIRRVSTYLNGTLVDFGLLDKRKAKTKKINHFQITQKVSIFLSYELHFSGFNDASVVAHEDWALFGLSKEDVRDELKQIAMHGHFLIQTAGDLIRISWKYSSWEELYNALT